MECNTGYIFYKIQEKDTIYKISNNFNTSVSRIIMANPNINVYNLQVNDEIIVPTETVVNTDINYTSEILEKNIKSLKMLYPFLEIGEIGKSVLGKNLSYIKIGTGNKNVFYNASFHANEWITTPVLMKFLEEYSKAFTENKNIYGYNAKYLYYSTSLYLVPMVNPDGVDLVTGSIKNVDNAYQKAQEIANNFPDIAFPSGWKANINGVDLKNLQPILLTLVLLVLQGF